MKKSRMLQEICYLVCDHANVDEEGEIYLKRSDARKILEGLEKLGMLPPKRKLEDDECVGIYHEYKYTIIRPYVNTWEEE